MPPANSIELDRFPEALHGPDIEVGQAFLEADKGPIESDQDYSLALEQQLDQGANVNQGSPDASRVHSGVLARVGLARMTVASLLPVALASAFASPAKGRQVAEPKKVSASIVDNIFTTETPDTLANLAIPYGSDRDYVPDVSVDRKTAKELAEKQLQGIKGFSVKPMQKVDRVTTDEGSVKVSYVCGPDKKTAFPQIDSITTHYNNRASIAFCPTDKDVMVTQPKTSSPSYKPALGKFLGDKMRLPFGGDSRGLDYSDTCASYIQGTQSARFASLKLNPQKGSAKAYILSPSIPDYCDLMGSYVQTIGLQYAKAGSRKFKPMGNEVVLISGLREVLAQDYDYKTGSKYKVNIQNLGKICSKEVRAGRARVTVTERFVPSQDQTFFTMNDGSIPKIRGGSEKSVGRPINICK
jgi:hypothetical protein